MDQTLNSNSMQGNKVASVYMFENEMPSIVQDQLFSRHSPVLQSSPAQGNFGWDGNDIAEPRRLNTIKVQDKRKESPLKPISRYRQQAPNPEAIKILPTRDITLFENSYMQAVHSDMRRKNLPIAEKEDVVVDLALKLAVNQFVNRSKTQPQEGEVIRKSPRIWDNPKSGPRLETRN
jgi:hypothetical protein